MSTSVDSRWYELRDAVYERRYGDAEVLIAQQPALLAMTDGLGETVLHFLAVENDLEGVQWLRAKGADLDTVNAFGTPALFEVAQLEYRDLYSWFVEHGANHRAVDRKGNNIVDYLLQFDREGMAAWVQSRDA